MDERPRRNKRMKVVVGAVCVKLALASCVGDPQAAMQSAPPGEAGRRPRPSPTWAPVADAGQPRVEAPSTDAGVALKHPLFGPSASRIVASPTSEQRARWSPPVDALDTGLTTTLSSSSTVIAIDIAQADDPGDPSYAWFENVDGDPEYEPCTCVDDDETVYRYVFCERFSDVCADSSELEGVLLLEFAPDDTYTVVLFGADLCGSSNDAPACSYDAAGNELSCGTWFGAVVEPVDAT